MLSAYGREVIAFSDEGASFYHPHCAREKFSELTVEKAELGMGNGADLHPHIRYTLESDFYPEGLTCDHCGLWIVEDDPEGRPANVSSCAALIAEGLIRDDSDLYDALRGAQYRDATVRDIAALRSYADRLNKLVADLARDN